LEYYHAHSNRERERVSDICFCLYMVAVASLKLLVGQIIAGKGSPCA
jgi:hypothetical protein